LIYIDYSIFIDHNRTQLIDRVSKYCIMTIIRKCDAGNIISCCLAL